MYGDQFGEFVSGYRGLNSNGHLYKTDTWCWSPPFFNYFTVTILPIRRKPLQDGQQTIGKCLM